MNLIKAMEYIFQLLNVIAKIVSWLFYALVHENIWTLNIENLYVIYVRCLKNLLSENVYRSYMICLFFIINVTHLQDFWMV